MNWPIARVAELLSGKESLVRVVSLQTTKGTVLRTAQRLYPLEINTSYSEKEPTVEQHSTSKTEGMNNERKSAGVRRKSRIPAVVTSRSRVVKLHLRFPN